jgi:fructokinase
LKKQGVISLGEAFIDFISIDASNTKYQQLLGGATVNVAVGTSRLGIPSYYLCKIGTDSNSQFVSNQLTKEKVNTEYCIRTPEKQICEVYVHINEKGERYFHSYKNPSPDVVLTDGELNKVIFQSAKIFYFGSGTLFHDLAKKTTEKALLFAKEAGTLVAFDTNIRLKRWDNEDQCRRTISSFLKHADIVKMAEDELLFITETKSLDAGLEKLANLSIPYIFITRGNEGAIVQHGNELIQIPAKNVKAIDTTGAGDAFMSAILYCFHEKGIQPKLLKDYLEFANEIGAIATTHFGALTAVSDIKPMIRKEKRH